MISLSLVVACSDDTSEAETSTGTESETGDGDGDPAGDGDGDTSGDGDGDTSGDGDGDPTTTGDGDGDTSGDGDGDTSGDGDGDGDTIPAECGNGIAEEGEDCDGDDLAAADCVTQGFDDGVLACADDCSFDTTMCITAECGNGVQEGMEVCDGDDLVDATCETQGFDEGALTCADTCDALVTDACVTWECGNDILEGEEVCDTSQLAGETCETQGFDLGTLACDDVCGLDTSGCSNCALPDPDDADVGPDNFGYFMVHSTNMNGLCAHQFIDLSQDMEATALDAAGNCGDSSVAVDLNADFSFYGVDEPDMWVNACAFITTTDDSQNDFSNDCPLPAVPSGGTGARIYAFHDDIELKDGGVVYHKYFDACPRASDTLGDTACEVFHWADLTPWNQDVPTYGINIILYPATGAIVYAYDDQVPAAGSATIGIMNGAFDDGVGVCNEDQAFANDGSTCVFHPDLSCG